MLSQVPLTGGLFDCRCNTLLQSSVDTPQRNPRKYTTLDSGPVQRFSSRRGHHQH